MRTNYIVPLFCLALNLCHASTVNGSFSCPGPAPAPYCQGSGFIDIINGNEISARAWASVTNDGTPFTYRSVDIIDTMFASVPGSGMGFFEVTYSDYPSAVQSAGYASNGGWHIGDQGGAFPFVFGVPAPFQLGQTFEVSTDAVASAWNQYVEVGGSVTAGVDIEFFDAQMRPVTVVDPSGFGGIPEPSSFTMFVLGGLFGALCFIRRFTEQPPRSESPR